MSTMPERGFSLIELIVVIIIIGVLAISLVPRFFSASGSSEYLLREQAVAVLRRAQQQAMQCTATNPAICPPVSIRLTSDRLGTTTACLNDASHLCITDGSVQLSSQPANLSELNFDSWGRPVQCQATGCQIRLQGQVTLSLCLESEGFIHLC